MRKLWVLPVLLIAITASAQSPDPHLSDDPAHLLFQQSSWAHGYLHGYSKGFHTGDLDLQLAHAAQNPKDEHEYKKAKDSYQRNFGDRDSFVEGFRAGFMVGYADAYGGLEFRAVKSLRELARDVPHVSPAGASILNGAIEKGYKDGRKIGLNDGRVAADYRPDGSDCELSLRFKDAPAPFYCSVYALAYRMGYGDGYSNQRPHHVERQIAGER